MLVDYGKPLSINRQAQSEIFLYFSLCVFQKIYLFAQIVTHGLLRIVDKMSSELSSKGPTYWTALSPGMFSSCCGTLESQDPKIPAPRLGNDSFNCFHCS